VVLDCCAGDEGVGANANGEEEDGCGDERRLVCGISKGIMVAFGLY
jgi:hypothetical protein